MNIDHGLAVGGMLVPVVDKLIGWLSSLAKASKNRRLRKTAEKKLIGFRIK